MSLILLSTFAFLGCHILTNHAFNPSRVLVGYNPAGEAQERTTPGKDVIVVIPLNESRSRIHVGAVVEDSTRHDCDRSERAGGFWRRGTCQIQRNPFGSRLLLSTDKAVHRGHSGRQQVTCSARSVVDHGAGVFLDKANTFAWILRDYRFFDQLQGGTADLSHFACVHARVVGGDRSASEGEDILQLHYSLVTIRSPTLAAFPNAGKAEIVQLATEGCKRRVVEVAREDARFNLDPVVDDNSA